MGIILVGLGLPVIYYVYRDKIYEWQRVQARTTQLKLSQSKPELPTPKSKDTESS